MRRTLLLVLAGLVALWLGACAVLFVWPPAQSGPPRHADAIVMLSGDRLRLPRALGLIRRGIAPVLALSSVRRTPHWRAARRLCAAKRYGSAQVICFDAEPYSTRGEAETIGRLARAHHWNRIVVVTSTYHLTRARMLIRRCYRGDLWLQGASSAWWELPNQWAEETGKLTIQLLFERGC